VRLLSAAIPTNDGQEAFVTVDIRSENLAVLQLVEDQAHSLKSHVFLVFLDTVKAFDTVSNKSLDRALKMS